MTVFRGDGARAGPAGRRRALAPAENRLSLRLIAEPAAPSVVRGRIRSWLEGHGWPEDAIDDVVLAVHEAVANVVDHAYPPGATGKVAISASVLPDGRRRRRARVVVKDGGNWRPPPADPGYRGRGLQMVRGCMDVVDIHPGTDGRNGTKLTMLTAAVGTTPADAGRHPRLRRLHHDLLDGVHRAQQRTLILACAARRLVDRVHRRLTGWGVGPGRQPLRREDGTHRVRYVRMP
ncbi:ATP-binding protein [Pseudonocardia sp.]|uniref:ATP-binding protein n=1 Tax=Pseudonocardia sp. TaxID=60912 RepID=UPI0031FC6937